MYIEITIEDEVVKRFHLPDEYLQDIPTLTEEQNFLAREKIINMHVEQLSIEYASLFHNHVVGIWLVFESKMNQPRKTPPVPAGGSKTVKVV